MKKREWKYGSVSLVDVMTEKLNYWLWVKGFRPRSIDENCFIYSVSSFVEDRRFTARLCFERMLSVVRLLLEDIHGPMAPYPRVDVSVVPAKRRRRGWEVVLWSEAPPEDLR